MAESIKIGGGGPSKPPKPGEPRPRTKRKSKGKSAVGAKEIALFIVAALAIAWLIIYFKYLA